VSRKRHREFSDENSIEVKNDGDYNFRVCKVENDKAARSNCIAIRQEKKASFYFPWIGMLPMPIAEVFHDSDRVLRNPMDLSFSGTKMLRKSL
jgi:hypothetical protein